VQYSYDLVYVLYLIKQIACATRVFYSDHNMSTVLQSKCFVSAKITFKKEKQKVLSALNEICGIWGSHSGGYEEYYLLEYNAM
jgi:hypothetical protein